MLYNISYHADEKNTSKQMIPEKKKKERWQLFLCENGRLKDKT